MNKRSKMSLRKRVAAAVVAVALGAGVAGPVVDMLDQGADEATVEARASLSSRDRSFGFRMGGSWS